MKISSYLIVDTADSIDLDAASAVAQPADTQWVLVIGLGALLMFAVLAFGAVEEWSTFAFEAGASVLFLVWAGKQFVSGQVTVVEEPAVRASLALFRAPPLASWAAHLCLRLHHQI